MRQLIAQSVRRPVAVSMIYVAFALLAVAAWINLPMELEITGNYPKVYVDTSWGMAAPEAVQALVTSPIEALAVSIPGINHVISQSSRGRSHIEMEVEEDASLDMVVFEITDRLALLIDDLPPGANRPVVSRHVPRQFQNEQSGPLIQYLLLSPRPLSDLRRYALDELRVRFESLNGVGRADVVGGTDPYLRVTIDPSWRSCTTFLLFLSDKCSSTSTKRCRSARSRCGAPPLPYACTIRWRIWDGCAICRSARWATRSYVSPTSATSK